MAQVEIEVLDKLPPTATETKGGGGKFKALYTLLYENKDAKTFFTKVKIGNKQARASLRLALKRKFGSTFVILKDEHRDDICYIRKNPYK